eukprot:scaffold3767_cov114-Isochrysis_galbana.AAC.2
MTARVVPMAVRVAGAAASAAGPAVGANADQFTGRQARTPLRAARLTLPMTTPKHQCYQLSLRASQPPLHSLCLFTVATVCLLLLEHARARVLYLLGRYFGGEAKVGVSRSNTLFDPIMASWL